MSRAKEYIYAVEFSTGAVKVGKTISGVAGRIRSHEIDAERFDVALNRQWFTEVHNGRACELLLIRAAHELGGDITRGLEYFRDLTFDDVVAAGERIAWREAAEETTRRIGVA